MVVWEPGVNPAELNSALSRSSTSRDESDVLEHLKKLPIFIGRFLRERETQTICTLRRETFFQEW